MPVGASRYEPRERPALRRNDTFGGVASLLPLSFRRSAGRDVRPQRDLSSGTEEEPRRCGLVFPAHDRRCDPHHCNRWSAVRTLRREVTRCRIAPQLSEESHPRSMSFRRSAGRSLGSQRDAPTGTEEEPRPCGLVFPAHDRRCDPHHCNRWSAVRILRRRGLRCRELERRSSSTDLPTSPGERRRARQPIP